MRLIYIVRHLSSLKAARFPACTANEGAALSQAARIHYPRTGCRAAWSLASPKIGHAGYLLSGILLPQAPFFSNTPGDPLSRHSAIPHYPAIAGTRVEWGGRYLTSFSSAPKCNSSHFRKYMSLHPPSLVRYLDRCACTTPVCFPYS